MRNQLESIRPTIKDLLIDKNTSAEESFQNLTLRPILKFQNSLFLSVFRNHLKKHKIAFADLKNIEKHEYIDQLIKKDRKMHNLFLGIVLGQLTDVEYIAYLAHEKELNRRISVMLIQRLQNQLIAV